MGFINRQFGHLTPTAKREESVKQGCKGIHDLLYPSLTFVAVWSMNTKVKGGFGCNVVVLYILDGNAYMFHVCVARHLCEWRAQLRHLRGSISMFMIAGGGGQEGHPVRSLKLWVCCDILHVYIYITPPSTTYTQDIFYRGVQIIYFFNRHSNRDSSSTF